MMQVCSATLSAKEVPTQIPADRAVKAILGEAENQGPRGMLAVACAIRNRGTIKGVYGYFKIHEHNGVYTRSTPRGSRPIPAWVVNQAKAAWNKSLEKDITHGATHWENVAAFGLPTWAKNMTRTFEYEGHVFFRGAL